jgi:hypothetical protein
VARTSGDAFDENEVPTAKRENLSAVDLANAANRTQELRPRDLLGSALLDRESPAPVVPSGIASGTRPVVTPDDVQRFEQEDAGPVRPRLPTPFDERSSAEPMLPSRRALFVTRHDGRVVVTPTLLFIAVALALVAGFLIARMR